MSDRLSERRISFVRDGSNLKEFSRCRPFLPKNRRWHPENITLIECYEMSVLQNVCCWRIVLKSLFEQANENFQGCGCVSCATT
jgi:hypothetical protein